MNKNLSNVIMCKKGLGILLSKIGLWKTKVNKLNK